MVSNVQGEKRMSQKKAKYGHNDSAGGEVEYDNLKKSTALTIYQLFNSVRKM